MQKFVKGRTNNHLSWMMVDATDFATPESAVSAATKIKIYGKLRSNDTVHFVSSGTGSLTNDIKHVGASATGLYTIGLVKADLSDASAAWYDQYIVNLSATGCAYQNLVVDGGIDDSVLLAYSDMISNAYSAALQANSRVLLVQSRLSDLDSRLVSDVSDVLSQLTVIQSMASDAVSAAVQANSRVLLCQSRISDAQSFLSDFQSDLLSHLDTTGVQLNASSLSDIRSAVAGVTASISTSDISDIASAVRATLVSDLSDILSAAQQTNSRVLLTQSRVSDIQSFLSDFRSDLLSHLDTTGVGLNASTMSDLRSAINGLTVSLDASNISDIASAVVAALPITSMVSDVYSLLSDLNSNFNSRVPKEPASRSQLSDMDSNLLSYLTGMSDMLSNTHSAAILGASHASDALSAANVGNSRTLVVQSRLSDFDSRMVSDISDIRSALSDAHSDIKSAIGGITVSLDASNISDIASAVVDAIGAGLSSDVASKVVVGTAASFSDIKSAITVAQSLASDAHSAANVAASRALINQSRISDVYSMLSDFQSDFGSRIPKEPAARSQLSDLYSDLLSYMVGLSAIVSDAHSAAILGASTASDTYSAALLIQSRLSDFDSRLVSDLSDVISQLAVVQSMASDAASAAQQGNSRVLLNQSRISDIQSFLSDMQSDLLSHLDTTGVQLNASSLSDIRSAIAATELDASDLSDIASAVWARVGADPTTVPAVNASMGAKVDWLAMMSRNKLTQTAALQTIYRDDGTTVAASAAVSDDATTYTRGEFG